MVSLVFILKSLYDGVCNLAYIKYQTMYVNLRMFFIFLQAIKHYETAADYYRGEESTSSANKCSLKVAQLSVQKDPPDFEKATQIFEMVSLTLFNRKQANSTKLSLKIAS